MGSKNMLKMIKIEKNAIIYKSIPFLVFILKVFDTKMSQLLKFLELSTGKARKLYSAKVSDKIDKLYSKKSITKIKPKYKKKSK